MPQAPPILLCLVTNLPRFSIILKCASLVSDTGTDLYQSSYFVSHSKVLILCVKEALENLITYVKQKGANIMHNLSINIFLEILFIY